MMFWGNEETPALTPYEPVRSYVKGNYLFNHKINSEIFFPRTTFISSFVKFSYLSYRSFFDSLCEKPSPNIDTYSYKYMLLKINLYYTNC